MASLETSAHQSLPFYFKYVQPLIVINKKRGSLDVWVRPLGNKLFSQYQTRCLSLSNGARVDFKKKRKLRWFFFKWYGADLTPKSGERRIEKKLEIPKYIGLYYSSSRLRTNLYPVFIVKSDWVSCAIIIFLISFLRGDEVNIQYLQQFCVAYFLQRSNSP